MHNLTTAISQLRDALQRNSSLAAVVALRQVLAAGYAALSDQLSRLQSSVSSPDALTLIDPLQQALTTFYQRAALDLQVRLDDPPQIVEAYASYWGQADISLETALAGMAWAIHSPVVSLQAELELIEQHRTLTPTMTDRIHALQAITTALMEVWVLMRAYVERDH
jgi:hypothetical protein